MSRKRVKNVNMTEKKDNKSDRKMWDLMIPIFLVIIVLPLITRLAIYDCGYGHYDWFAGDGFIDDFYCYYKNLFLVVVGIFSLFIAMFYVLLYKEKAKSIKTYFPMLGYGLLALFSTAFSINPQASVSGNYYSFESILVLLAYIVMSFYAYELMDEEQDFRLVFYSILAITIIFIALGALQALNLDPFDTEFAKKLIMSHEQYLEYGDSIEDAFSGNNVYLSLYNPNYAGVFMSMAYAIVLNMALSEENKKKRYAFIAISILTAVIVWFTYSRMSLITVIFTTFVSLLIWKNKRDSQGNSKKMLTAGIVIIVILALVGVDAKLGFKFISRMIDKNDREPLTELTTNEDGIWMVYGKKTYQIYTTDDLLYVNEYGKAIDVYDSDAVSKVVDSKEAKQSVEKIGETVKLPTSKEDGVLALDNETVLLQVADDVSRFERVNGKFLLSISEDKYLELPQVDRISFGGLEYLASARGYIWSRTLPLLKDRIVLGSGPDTFPEVFPQDDIAGKIVYSDSSAAIIEKGHNDYLTKWIHTGGLSVICLLFFYMMVIKAGSKLLHRGIDGECDYIYRLGTGAFIACIGFMIASFTNDSTIQSAPLFWICTGIVLAANHMKNN